MLGYSAIHGGPCSTFFIYSPHQWTPLHFAAYLGHVDIVRCLVEHSADPNIKDHRDGVSELVYTADYKLVYCCSEFVSIHPNTKVIIIDWIAMIIAYLAKAKIVNMKVGQAKNYSFFGN